MELQQRVESIINDQIRPIIESHGGGIELETCKNGLVTVKLLGACSGCPSADLSTKSMIEECLMAELPEIKGVEIYNPVSKELLNFARQILSGKNL